MRLFIGGVAWETTDQTLGRAFERFGKVRSARVVIDRETGRSKGFGFVEFVNVADAEKALQAAQAGLTIDGRDVRVDKAVSTGPRDGGAEAVGHARNDGGQRPAQGPATTKPRGERPEDAFVERSPRRRPVETTGWREEDFSPTRRNTDSVDDGTRGGCSPDPVRETRAKTPSEVAYAAHFERNRDED